MRRAFNSLVFVSLTLLLQAQQATATMWLTFHSSFNCSDSQPLVGQGPADGSCLETPGQYRSYRVVGDIVNYTITAFHSDNSACSNNNELVLQYDKCYNGTGETDVTHFTVKPVNATGGTPQPSKGHSLTKTVLICAIVIPVGCVAAILLICCLYGRKVPTGIGHLFKGSSTGSSLDKAVEETSRSPPSNVSPTSHAHAQPDSRDAFEVAIICALRIESDAVEALFDQFWEEIKFGRVRGDPNSYTLGRIGQHNVVLAYMPGMGKAASAAVAASFRVSFPSIRLGLVVGICGGLPQAEETNTEILLGDVIISTGVIQFDFGRQLVDQVVRKNTLEDSLGRPNPETRGFLQKMQGWRASMEISNEMAGNIAEIYSKADFKDWKHPGIQYDYLFPATYRHKHQILGECSICDKCISDNDPVCDDALSSDCTVLKCDMKKVVARGRVQELHASLENMEQTQSVVTPLLHFGLVASGDLVMKSAARRDHLAAREKVIAFEMEGAGAWDTFPTVIIKSVCDYADSHKNKKWQKYAAVTAAACTKAFLRQWRGVEKNSTVVQGSSVQQQNGQPANVRQGGAWVP